MSISTRALRVVSAFVLTALLAVGGFADTLRLKDGSIIKGNIIGFANGTFTVEIGEGARRRQLTFTAGEVESIKFDMSSSTAQTTRTASYTEPDRKPEPKQDPPPVIIHTDPKPQPDDTSAGKMKPIAWSVRVTADNTSNGWTNTGWVVKKGQRIRVTGDGKVTLGPGRTSPPSGSPEIADEQKLLKNVATGALIAVIGDDNNDFIYVGASREFTATRDGALFLGVNEGYLEDNSGAYNVKVEILPEEAG